MEMIQSFFLKTADNHVAVEKIAVPDFNATTVAHTLPCMNIVDAYTGNLCLEVTPGQYYNGGDIRSYTCDGT